MFSTDDVPMADAGAGAGELLLVWPWTGVLATTSTGDHDACAAAVILLASHARQHPAAVATTPLVQDAAPPDTHRHHFLVLHFGKSFAGLQAAASLADSFDGAGRTEWQHQQQHDENAGPGAVAVYGWTAVEEDLRGDDAVGRFLRATAATARSAEDAVAGEHERTARLLETRCEEAAAAVRAAEEEMNFLRDEHAELRTIADKIVPEMNREVEEENENLKAALEAVTREIESKMEKITQLKDLEKDTLDIRTLDQAGAECEVDGHALMLHEHHKREMETIHARRTQLEEQLEEREALVFLIQQLNRKLQAGEKLTDTVEDHMRVYSVTIHLNDELERLKASWLDLYKELQENRQELIQGFFLEDIPISGCMVGIKRMGQLDERPFQVACKRKYRDDDPEGKVASLVSSWHAEIQKMSWHPFTTIQVDGEDKEVIDDDDPKLRQLRLEYGDNVCHAVKAALSELNEHNPYERHIVNEIWNFQEGRKATMTEAIMCIMEQLTVADQGLGGCEFNIPPEKCSASI